MELTSLKNDSIISFESGFNVEQLKPVSRPDEIDRARQVFEQAKNNLKTVNESDKLSDEKVKRFAEQLNDVMDSLNIQMRVSVEGKGLGRLHIRVVNTETNEVLREIPPEKISAFGSRLLDAVGLIIDEMA